MSSPNGDQWRTANLHDIPAHAHSVAEQQGKQTYMDGPEHTRVASEHMIPAHQQSSPTTSAHGVVSFGHREIAALAHELWLARGCPEGSPEEDWFKAAHLLRARAETSAHGQ